MNRLIRSVLVLGLLVAAGCNGENNTRYMTPERLSSGLVVILPGIEGVSGLNQDVRRGLVSGGIGHAVPIYSWGRPIPGLGLLLNQMDFLGNRLAGLRIAKMIEQYQEDHPGRPVYVVGHSGGGGVAVFVAEGMSEGKKVDGLVLLSASIWAGYDLTKALGRCRSGIVNFYNESDVGVLGIGTTFMGNVDGMRGPSAGLIGFDKPKDGDSEEKKLAYTRVYQVQMTPAMTGGGDAHTVVTHPGFVAMYVSPWVGTSSWPAGFAVPAANYGPLPSEVAEAIAALTHR